MLACCFIEESWHRGVRACLLQLGRVHSLLFPLTELAFRAGVSAQGTESEGRMAGILHCWALVQGQPGMMVVGGEGPVVSCIQPSGQLALRAAMPWGREKRRSWGARLSE